MQDAKALLGPFLPPPGPHLEFLGNTSSQRRPCEEYESFLLSQLAVGCAQGLTKLLFFENYNAISQLWGQETTITHQWLIIDG